MNTTPEKMPQTPETETNPNIELEQAGHERREALRERHEQSKESPEHDVDTLHEKALEHAASAAPEKIDTRNDSPAERRNNGPISRKERDASFNATMKEVRTHMPASSRIFSSVVHNKTVEKISESTGATIARPNAILSGAIAAFVVTLAVYLIAKNYGYPLSGFESIGAFVVGWLLGLVYDFLKVMITGRT